MMPLSQSWSTTETVDFLQREPRRPSSDLPVWVTVTLAARPRIERGDADRDLADASRRLGCASCS
jgi:hypothetical protein